MKILLTLASVLAISGVAGCGGGAKPSDTTPSSFLSATPLAVVKGRLLQVDLSGRNPKPATGTVILIGANGAEVADEVDSRGAFEIRVYPGEYQVTGTSPQPDGGTARCAAKESKTLVSAEAATSVDVLCFVQ